jgi:glycosyltransferase involved in cell wall biosynthesis
VKKPLHVLHIIAQMFPGGAERQLLRFVQLFDGERIRSSVITWHVHDPVIKIGLEEAGCPVHVLNRRRSKGLLFPLELARVARRLRPDLIHGWLVAGTYYGVPLAKGYLRRPLVLSVRSSPASWPGWLRIAHTVLWRGADHILANSRRNAALFTRLCHARKTRVTVQYNGIDIARFQPNHPERLRAETRATLGLHHEHQVISIVGRLRAEKNHPLLLRSVEALRSEFPQLRVLVIGDGDLDRPLGEWVHQHDLQSTVRLLGRREDIPALLAAADLHVLCSDFEGMPNAVLEAMAAGRPVISTDVGGVTEVLRSGTDGLVIPPGDQAALTNAIQWMLNHPDRAAAMAASARQRIGQSWDIARVTEELTELYETLTRRR